MKTDSVTLVRLPDDSNSTIKIQALTCVTLQTKRVVNVDKDGAHTGDALVLFIQNGTDADVKAGDFLVPSVNEAMIAALPGQNSREQRATINSYGGRVIRSISDYSGRPRGHIEVTT